MTRSGFLRRQRDMFPSTADAGAVLSPCEQYRYTLWRQWEGGQGTVVFIGLNPSVADAIIEDPTIRRCKQFAIDWGYHRLVMVNLFAFRATDPEDMLSATDPVGPDNDAALIGQCAGANLVVAAWGNDGVHAGRAQQVCARIAAFNPMCFRMTAMGQPIHPLYQRRSAPLVPFVIPR